MAIMDANYDQEMMRLWGVISDLSEQLNQHRATANLLKSQAEGIRVSFCDVVHVVDVLIYRVLCVIESSHPLSNRLRVAQVRVRTCNRFQTMFILQVYRFNMDKSQGLYTIFSSATFSSTHVPWRTEEYDAELDRMTNAVVVENQGLQYENKQLNLLIKEYEQTLETLMTTFRKRAVSSSCW